MRNHGKEILNSSCQTHHEQHIKVNNGYQILQSRENSPILTKSVLEKKTKN
jgi:hypothetical protein